LNHARNGRALRKRQLIQVLSKIDARRLLDSANSDCPALPQIDFITVKRKDVLLREATLKRESRHRFGEFTADGALR
jgi:hypothetical protein